MGAPYSATSVSNYNVNPPPDDGSTSPSNRVTWAGQKTKLSDPIKTAFDTSETNTVAGFAKVIGGGAILSTAVDYTVLAADQGKLIKVTASGKTITTPDATVVGSPFWFMVKNQSTGAITLAGNNPGVQQTVDGANSLSIASGVGIMVGTDGTNWITDGIPSNVLPVPQGRLTGTSLSPVSGDVGATAIFYTPFSGSWTIVHNGSTLVPFQFAEMGLVLTSSQAANNIYDIFIANNGGVPVIGTGPSWSAGTSGSITPGSCARGTGAGGTSLARLNGVLVNNVQISLIWNTGSGNTTITVPANQGVYLGSIYVDATAGNVSCLISSGQNRKYGIWNCYNRVPIIMQEADPGASWTYGTNTTRASNNAPSAYSGTVFNVGSGTNCNGITAFCGLAETEITSRFTQRVDSGLVASTVTLQATIGIGVNSTTAITGLNATMVTAQTGATEIHISQMLSASIVRPLTLGLTVLVATETAVFGTHTFNGTSGGMLLEVRYEG